MINSIGLNKIEEKQLKKIHENSLSILSELGVRIEHPQIRGKLSENGCKIKDNRVYIQPDLVANTIRDIPNSVTLHGRNGKMADIESNGSTLFTNTGILPNIVDFETGLVRRTLRSDIEVSTRILDALNEIDIVYVSLLDATDVEPHMNTLTDFIYTVKNTTKPLLGPGVCNKREAEAVVKIASLLGNNAKNDLSQNPTCAPFIAAISPLYFPFDLVDALITIARSGLPIIALTNPIMGSTAPYTIAGAVSLGHAEELAIAVMAHTINKQLPIISLNTPSVADLQTLTSTTGGPETGLMRSLAVKLANYLGMPSWGHGHTSSAILDEQASDEKSINSLLIGSANPSLLGGLGGLANVTLTSFETMALDNERFGAIRRILNGIDMDEDHLAFNSIKDMVNGANIIMHDHTIKYMRNSEVWKPYLSSRQGLVSGKQIFQSIKKRAKEDIINIIKNHFAVPLADDTQEALDGIMDEYDKKFIELKNKWNSG
jgi:trimethylamine---corrinoid protein Co-methyltransferase